MPRRRCKIKSVDEIKSLDSSSVRRLCSSSLPERREEALREVLRRAAQWDMECQDYARKLRVWQPQNVLRCLEGEPRAVGFVPPCREFCVPAFMHDTMLEDELVAVTMCSGSAFPTNDGPGDLEGNQACGRARCDQPRLHFGASSGGVSKQISPGRQGLSKFVREDQFCCRGCHLTRCSCYGGWQAQTPSSWWQKMAPANDAVNDFVSPN